MIIGSEDNQLKVYNPPKTNNEEFKGGCQIGPPLTLMSCKICNA